MADISISDPDAVADYDDSDIPADLDIDEYDGLWWASELAHEELSEAFAELAIAARDAARFLMWLYERGDITKAEWARYGQPLVKADEDKADFEPDEGRRELALENKHNWTKPKPKQEDALERFGKCQCGKCIELRARCATQTKGAK